MFTIKVVVKAMEVNKFLVNDQEVTYLWNAVGIVNGMTYPESVIMARTTGISDHKLRDIAGKPEGMDEKGLQIAVTAVATAIKNAIIAVEKLKVCLDGTYCYTFDETFECTKKSKKK